MKYYLFTFLFVFVLFGCCEVEPTPKEPNVFNLKTRFTNISGQGALLTTVDKSDKIVYDENSIVEIPSSDSTRINFLIPNVRIFGSEGVYKIDSILPYDLNGKVDSENKLKISSESVLDVVLVLDQSTSLGNDYESLIDAAKKFCQDLIFERSKLPNSRTRIGLVKFSREIYKLNLTSNLDSINTFLNEITLRRDETRLFEAINEGVNLFSGSNAQSTVLIVFTDGANNSNSRPEFENKNFVVERIQNETFGQFNQKIQCYPIGYTGKGNISEQELRSLQLNGGRFESNNSINTIFTRVFNRIASIYNLVYDRNNSFRTEPLEVRFEFRCTLVPNTQD